MNHMILTIDLDEFYSSICTARRVTSLLWSERLTMSDASYFYRLLGFWQTSKHRLNHSHGKTNVSIFGRNEFLFAIQNFDIFLTELSVSSLYEKKKIL